MTEGGRSPTDVACPAPIETEHEFVQVVLEVGPPQSVVNAQAPALEVCEQAMDPGQHNVRCHRTDCDGAVLDTRDALVGGPIILFPAVGSWQNRRNRADAMA